MWFQYVESPSFERRGLDPVSVLRQTMSGLAHLHSLSIGKGQQSPLQPPLLRGLGSGCGVSSTRMGLRQSPVCSSPAR